MFPRFRAKRATVVIDGASYVLRDWNSRGFMISPYPGRLRQGMTISTRLILPGKKESLSFSFNADAQIVRSDSKTDQLAAVFLDLDEKTIARIGRYLELMGGKPT